MSLGEFMGDKSHRKLAVIEKLDWFFQIGHKVESLIQYLKKKIKPQKWKYEYLTREKDMIIEKKIHQNQA
jgi:hypothetical protein